jgi:predicted GH43/DUF377 family glycosyl hydrolase
LNVIKKKDSSKLSIIEKKILNEEKITNAHYKTAFTEFNKKFLTTADGVSDRYRNASLAMTKDKQLKESVLIPKTIIKTEKQANIVNNTLNKKNIIDNKMTPKQYLQKEFNKMDF